MVNEVVESARGCPTCGADLICCPECGTRYLDGSGYCGTCDTFTGPSDLGLQRAAASASTPSPLTPEQAKHRAQQIIIDQFEQWSEVPIGLVDRIASELTAVATLSPSVGGANNIELLARDLVWSPDSWDVYLLAKEAGDGPSEDPEFWLLAQAVESKFGPQPLGQEDLDYVDRIVSKISAARTDDDVDAILRRSNIEPESLVNEFISRLGKELRLALHALPSGVHNALHAAREALERHLKPTGVTDHAYIEDALKAVNRELKLECAAAPSVQYTARKVAEKIAEIMGFNVDVRLDANGTRVQDIIVSGFTTTPSEDSSSERNQTQP